MKVLLGAFLYVASLSLTYANGGIGLDATRIIYPADSRAVNITVRNTDDALNYLIQPSITTDIAASETRTPFVFSPSLFKLQHGNEGVIKIMFLGHNELPKDRESLFWFSVKAIPSSEKDDVLPALSKVKGGVKIAIGNTIKLFYRPKNLTGTPDEAAGKLIFAKIKEGNLRAQNNSPYYVNIQSLVIYGKHVRSKNMMMVPPYGSLIFEGVVPPTDLKQIQWDVINDNGGVKRYGADA